MSKITINLSQSALSTTSCMLRFHRTVIDGYSLPASSANIVYGEAVHKYIDVMYRTNGHIPSARTAALEAFKRPKIIKPKAEHLGDANHMLCTCYNVWESWVMRDEDFKLIVVEDKCPVCQGTGLMPAPYHCNTCKGFGHISRPATELTFSIRYYEDDYIIINLCGTLDSIGQINGGVYAIRDWKTTSSWDAKGYFHKYELSKQLRFYVFALKLMNQMHPDSILGKIGGTKVGTFIDGIFIKPAASDNKYGRSEVFFYSDGQIDELKKAIDLKIQQISIAIATNRILKEGIVNGSCEGKWGLCEYWDVCKQEKDEIADVLLKRDFNIKVYNPLNYNE